MQDIAEIALLAFRRGRYRDAVELLLQVTDREPKNWVARFYLGLAYKHLGRLADAHRLFTRLATECDDVEIIQKVKADLPLLEAELAERFATKEEKDKRNDNPGLDLANWQ